MKSDGNYIEIYKLEEGKVVKSLTRGSISNFEDNLNLLVFPLIILVLELDMEMIRLKLKK